MRRAVPLVTASQLLEFLQGMQELGQFFVQHGFPHRQRVLCSPG
jgi:hypothetical protein